MKVFGDHLSRQLIILAQICVVFFRSLGGGGGGEGRWWQVV